MKEDLIEKYKDKGLKYPLTEEQVLELENEHKYSVDEDENITINTEDNELPFGTKYFIWREMKDNHLKGRGVIWHYNNIGILCGRAGYVLILDNRYLTGLDICTVMS